MTQITVADTVRSYSGKVGCMCGCQGTYNESERARKLAITQILKQNWNVQDFEHVDNLGTAGCIYVESDTRNRVLYLTEQGLIKATQLKKEVDGSAE